MERTIAKQLPIEPSAHEFPSVPCQPSNSPIQHSDLSPAAAIVQGDVRPSSLRPGNPYPLGDIALAFKAVLAALALAAIAADLIRGNYVGCLLIAAVALIAIFAHLRRAPQTAVAPPIAESAPDRHPHEEHMAALERKVGELEGLQKDLGTAKAAAEAALMAKGEFLATMSHEIRTPLNGMVPILELLLSTPLNGDQKDHLTTAYRSARELLRIVNDVLDYSKLEAGAVELETETFNLREAVEHVTRLLSRAAQAKSIALSHHIDQNVRLSVRGDALRLRQVLMNLVSNAIKFTAQGSVTISVSKRSESRMQYTLVFSVTDTGIGLTPDATQRLFRPFSQADASTTRKYGGTGLGLAISQRLVRAMGGEIGVSSQIGKGSTFWFSTTLLKAAGDIAPRDRIEGTRALVLCKEPQVLSHLTTSLRTLGVHALVADTVLDALRILRAQANVDRQELVIVDLKTFRHTILSLTRALLSEEGLHDVKVIAVGTEDEAPADLREHVRPLFLDRHANEQQLAQAVTKVFEADPTPAKSEKPLINIAPDDRPIDLQEAHILLVDDIPINRKVGQQVLSKLGVHVDLAEDGRDAIRHLERNTYDAVLMDCQMPDVDGYAAARVQREREKTQGSARVPIIAMTANAMPGDREKCLASGMDDYLSKPLDQNLLARTLARWIVRDRVFEESTSSERSKGAVPQRSHRSPLNLIALQALFAGITESTEQLVERWHRDARLFIGAIRTGLCAADQTAILRSVRALKSAAAAIDAHALALAAQSLECAAAAGSTKIEAELAVIEKHCEAVWQELRAQVGSHAPAAGQ